MSNEYPMCFWLKTKRRGFVHPIRRATPFSAPQTCRFNARLNAVQRVFEAIGHNAPASPVLRPFLASVDVPPNRHHKCATATFGHKKRGFCPLAHSFSICRIFSLIQAVLSPFPPPVPTGLPTRSPSPPTLSLHFLGEITIKSPSSPTFATFGFSFHSSTFAI